MSDQESQSAQECDSQSFLMSKTQWAALLVAVAPSIPPVQALLVANPELAGVLVGALFSIIRWAQGRVGGGGKKLVVKPK